MQMLANQEAYPGHDTECQLSPAPCAEAPNLVLIIEDDQDQAEVLTYRLETMGMQAVVANRGKTGLEMAKKERPRLILLDLSLPDAEGLEICEQLSGNPETCTIPIVVISGRGQSDMVRQCRQAGCTYFIRKPYDPSALLLVINDVLGENTLEL